MQLRRANTSIKNRLMKMTIVALSLTAGVMAQQQKPQIPTPQELKQLDAVLDATPDLGHLFRATPIKLVDPSVITKFPSLQALFKQNPDLLLSIVRYKNSFQQREFRYAYGEAGTLAIPRGAVTWFDDYLGSTPAVAATLKKSPAEIDNRTALSDPVLVKFLETYPTFSQVFKTHASVYLFSPDFFKPYR